jgi:hypothetical protein
VCELVDLLLLGESSGRGLLPVVAGEEVDDYLTDSFLVRVTLVERSEHSHEVDYAHFGDAAVVGY